MTEFYAHSFQGRPVCEWEPLAAHLGAVAERAEGFAGVFGWGAVGRAAGWLHDIGKCSERFQGYLRVDREAGGGARGPDHSTAGAREARDAYRGQPQLGVMLGAIIAGHHAGLADLADLPGRLERGIEPYEGWRGLVDPLPGAKQLIGAIMHERACDKGFAWSFLIRMLFSALVDADYLETERAVAAAEGRDVERGGHESLTVLGERLLAYMERKGAGVASPLQTVRNEVLSSCIAGAALVPGLFTLTVPTGGGKTLASLSFALEHARRHGLRRVVYVIPFTSIIEQTAAVFREALGSEADVLEHHAGFDWDAAGAVRGDEGQGPDALARLRRATENWDVPIVVTTAVQFFESLFGNRTSRCRKLHNLARSVIVLDEAQTLPLPLLHPCMAALDQLTRNYGASVVLCTATQPALRLKDGFKTGFDLGEERELAPDPAGLYRALRRVAVERLPGITDDVTIAARFAEQPQMLCIVGTRPHARALFDAIRDLPGATHLTTLMCPRHRRAVLAGVRERLARGEPVRLVSTSLIEAGVDVDFPEVWRAAAGLESVAQAAGRCNREGKLAVGRVVVFEPADARPLAALEMNRQAARAVLRDFDDVLGLDAVQAYFKELYWQKGEAALDAPGIMRSIASRLGTWHFPFAKIAEDFRMIDDAAQPVIVPWDEAARALLARVASMERALVPDLRALQQYVVGIPRRVSATWLAQGVLRPVRPEMGEALLRFKDLSHYDPQTGVDLLRPELRGVEDNLF